MEKELLSDKDKKKRKPNAQALSAASASYQELADVSPHVSNLTQLQRRADEAPVQRMQRGGYGPLDEVNLDGNFKDRAIEKLQIAGESDVKGLNEDLCSATSQWIFGHLKTENAAGNGRGHGSLITAMNDAATHRHRNNVFIYQVNADVIGHQFTILQHFNQATIIQGYNKLSTVAKSIGSGGTAHNVRDVAEITGHLSTIFGAYDAIFNDLGKLNRANVINPLFAAHEALFGFKMDGGDKINIQTHIQQRVVAKEKLTWEASYSEGNGPLLDTSEPSSKCCFLTTAVVEQYGLPDQCIELMTLRHFRDTYMRRQAEGNAEIDAYYDMAPRIVEAIRALPRVEQEAAWAAIYNTVRFCVEAVHAGENAIAHETYKAQVLALQARYLKATPIPSK